MVKMHSVRQVCIYHESWYIDYAKSVSLQTKTCSLKAVLHKMLSFIHSLRVLQRRNASKKSSVLCCAVWWVANLDQNNWSTVRKNDVSFRASTKHKWFFLCQRQSAECKDRWRSISLGEIKIKFHLTEFCIALHSEGTLFFSIKDAQLLENEKWREWCAWWHISKQ